MATIRDVARECGLSISTVSIVLNGKAAERKIPPETVRHVLDTASRLQYRPNRAARVLRGMTQRPVVALFWVLDNRSTFFMRVVRGLEMVFNDQEAPCDLVIHPYENGKLREHEPLLLSGDYDALLIGALSTEDLTYLEGLQPPMPVYLLNRMSERFPGCSTDPQQIGAAAADWMLRHGCRKLAFVADREAVVPKTTRRNAIIAACRERGILSDDALMVDAPNSISGGMEAARPILSAGQRPDMIFVDTDVMALGLSLGLRMRDVTDIPMLCIALNHPDLDRHLSPTLSLIDIPGERIGRESAMQVRDLLYHQRALTSVVCQCEMAE